MDIEILVDGEGLADVEVVPLPAGRPGIELIEVIAKRAGYPAAEALLFIEDEDEPLDIAAIVIGEEMAGRVHHVHRAREIKVTVNYQNPPKHKEFPPSARMQRVLDWATGPHGFKIDPALAPEMELALHGTQTALPKSAHIGRYAHGHEHKLDLDLIRGVVPNGGVR
ncbi:MAG: hypothetical protein WAW96_19570 [Alphaproteobacteria bacterium]